MGKQRRSTLLLTSAFVGLAFFGLGGVASAADQTYQFDIPAEALSQALTDFSQASSRQIIFSEDVLKGRKVGGLHGRFTAAQALDTLLAGTDLRAETNPAGVLMVRSKNAQAAQNDTAAEVETVVVTGSRIKDAPPTSRVIEITQQQVREAGQNNLGEVVRSIPENFSGGQNPGIAAGTGISNPSNGNVTGGSAINLRGLGPDATLTLLDGRRLSYDGYSQAVDISAIPLAAVDRIEIVADGASAIYGSDAVAGVANVILKSDYDGVTTSARLGQATNGGDFQQEDSVVGGKSWSTGGFIAAYDFDHDDAIYANQRRYTNYLPEPYTLSPAQQNQALLFNAHQDIGALVTFSLDALYDKRRSNVAKTSDSQIATGSENSTNYSVSPTLTFKLPGTWTATVNGLYGRDLSRSITSVYSLSKSPKFQEGYCECNSIVSTEVDAEGPLFQLPGGDARLALGGGYHQSSFDEYSIVGSGGSLRSAP